MLDSNMVLVKSHQFARGSVAIVWLLGSSYSLQLDSALGRYLWNTFQNWYFKTQLSSDLIML